MPEWWGYTLSDIQSFSLHSYYRLFELYNRAIWPAQLAALLLGTAIAVRLHRWSGRTITALLAACGLWVAIVFHAHRYATLTWTAKYFAWGFGVQAALLLATGALRPRLAFERRPAGLAIFLFALLVQPVVGALVGRSWSQVEVFGVAPDPTAIGTMGIVLLAAGRVRWELLLIPLLWCAISGATLLSMDAPDAWIPIGAGPLVVSLAAWQTFARRAKKSRKEVR
jgi:hypothetical protein